MKNISLLILIGVCIAKGTLAQNPNLAWAKQLGGTSSDNGNSLAIDASGNVYSTGFFTGISDFDPGPGVFNLVAFGNSDIFISKIGPTGNFLWAEKIGGLGNDLGWCIKLDAPGNIYIAGYFNGTVDFDPGAGSYTLASKGNNDAFIVKLDASGNFVWARSWGGTNVDIAYSIAIDASGNVYTGGSFSNNVDFDPGSSTFTIASNGSYDVFVSKLDVSGNFIWAKTWGGTGPEDSYKMSQDALGDLIVVGYFSNTVDFDPSAATYTLVSVGSSDMFISKLDASGNFVWAKQIGSVLNGDVAQAVINDASGNIYLSGFFGGTADFDPGTSTFTMTPIGNYDIFVSKLDASGNFLFAKQMGGTDYEYGTDIALDGSGNIYTCGYFYGTCDFDPGAATFTLAAAALNSNVFVSKLDPSGNFVWAVSWGGVNGEIARSLALDLSGNIYSIGDFSGIVDFDPGVGVFNMTPAGGSDCFIHKMYQSTTGSFEKNIGSNVLLYPSMTKDVINLKLNKEYLITVYSVDGKQIEQRQVNGNTLLDVSQYQSGLYFITGTNKNEEMFRAKFVRE